MAARLGTRAGGPGRQGADRGSLGLPGRGAADDSRRGDRLRVRLLQHRHRHASPGADRDRSVVRAARLGRAQHLDHRCRWHRAPHHRRRSRLCRWRPAADPTGLRHLRHGGATDRPVRHAISPCPEAVAGTSLFGGPVPRLAVCCRGCGADEARRMVGRRAGGCGSGARTRGFRQEELADETVGAERPDGQQPGTRQHPRAPSRTIRMLGETLGLPGKASDELVAAYRAISRGSPAVTFPELAPPAATVAAVVPRELPGLVPHFVGREDELAALDALADRATVRRRGRW